jgi:hypothetical protein
MKKLACWIFILTLSISITAYSSDGGWSGYPTKDLVYKFEVYTGKTDRWDSAKQDTPQLSPGKASLAAKEFIRTVPLQDDMKDWRLSAITLKQISPTPEEWVYVVHFDANPKSGVWNGPVPWIDIPVRFDGSIPKPTITKAPQQNK